MADMQKDLPSCRKSLLIHITLCIANILKCWVECVFVFVFQMCERCNRRTECTKRLSIQRFPQVIVIRILDNILYVLLILFTSYVYMKEIMMSLNNLNQIWIVLQRQGGLSAKAPCTCPSHSRTWTSGPTDLLTVVKLSNFPLSLSTMTRLFYSSMCAWVIISDVQQLKW